jgi:hypothetical protein
LRHFELIQRCKELTAARVGNHADHFRGGVMFL